VDYRTDNPIIRQGLDKVAELNSAIALLEQVNPTSTAITQMYVKSVMCYAVLEQMIAVDSEIIYMDPNSYRQLGMELIRIVKTNI
jgi:hypothetical protein